MRSYIAEEHTYVLLLVSFCMKEKERGRGRGGGGEGEGDGEREGPKNKVDSISCSERKRDEVRYSSINSMRPWIPDESTVSIVDASITSALTTPVYIRTREVRSKRQEVRDESEEK